MEWIDLNELLPWLFITCGTLLLIQLLYYCLIYNKIFRHSRNNDTPDKNYNYPPLSVIIVTKDAGSQLEQNLPAILSQDFPDFEVIVVNDQSAGEDEDILKRMDTQYPNLYHTFIPKTARYVSRKKLGIAMGIRASRYEWVVMTNPNCKPDSNQWLRKMAENFTPGTDVVLGYTGYVSQKGSFARKVIYNSTLHAMRFLGQALCGMPYMGNGNNLAYRKSAYQSHKGFSHHLNLKGGEDDLLVNELANKNNTRVECSAESIVRIPVPKYKRIWLEEQVNLLVTGKYYKGYNRLLNGLETLSRIFFLLSLYCCIVVSILLQQWILLGIAILTGLIRLAIQAYTFVMHAKTMKESNFCFWLPLYDWLQPLWSLSVRLHYLFRNKTDFLRK